MKIGVISSTVFAVGPGGLKGYGGLEQLAWQQAIGLAAKGHEVVLFAPEGSTCEGATVVPIGPPGGWDEARAYSSYWQNLLGLDAVIDNSWCKFSYLLKTEGRLLAPVLGVCHAPIDTMYKTLPDVEKPCFVCISEDQAAHFRALFSRDVRVAYNGIDLDFYRPMGIPRSKRFLFLARFSYIKGPMLAIEACKKAGVGLDLIGDTSITNEPEYLAQCLAAADGKQIRIVGPATRGECVWWFSQAHCMIHPNRDFREPFGLAPVEAMACGCPVIAWDRGAMRETVKDAKYRLISSVDDLVAMVKDHAKGYLHEQGKLTEREECREWATQFSVGRMVDRYEQLCREAVEGGGW